MKRRSVRVRSKKFRVHEIVERCSQGMRVGVQGTWHWVVVGIVDNVCVYATHEVWNGGCRYEKFQFNNIFD